MKTRLLTLTAICLLTASFFVCPTTATASNVFPTFSKKLNNHFSFFRTHRQGKGITATWGMQVSGSVREFIVERTYMDASDEFALWEELDVIPCNGARSFTYNDSEVMPGFINYRIRAIMIDGSVAESHISTIRVVSRK